MRRWNGWGDEAIEYPLPEPALSFLQARLGPAQAPEDAQLSSVLEQAPDSRLPVHGLVTTDALERLRHARGQSLPDWIQLRAGMIDSWPDGVAYAIVSRCVWCWILHRRSGPTSSPTGAGPASWATSIPCGAKLRFSPWI